MALVAGGDAGALPGRNAAGIVTVVAAFVVVGFATDLGRSVC